MRKIQKLLLILLMMAMLLPTFAVAETPVIVNLVENPDAVQGTEEEANGTTVLQLKVAPDDMGKVIGKQGILLRYDGMVMMIDASTKNATMRNRIYTACDTLGIDHIDIAYNSHPHDDHIDGFQFVNEYAPISKFLITFPEDFNARMKSTVKFMKANNIPIEQIGNGDTFTLGEDGGVKMTVIQYHKSSWGVNDQSAMLMVQYGDRRMLLAGDNENRSQQYFAANPPEIGLNADIFKYPHHGQVRLRDDFLEAINPQLIFINGAANVIKGSVNYCDKKHISYLLGYKGLTRMRTDGNIWVIDYLKEKNADRDLPYTPERDE